ncbi:SET domain-containing protein, partial [Zopfia rhizophila CBS 207.26]
PQISLATRNGVPCKSFSWTHDPTCFMPVFHKNKSYVAEFCVYTNAVFANGRGISLITTPEVVASFSASYPSMEYKEHENQALYESRQTGDRGVGLFANQPITAGSTYMRNAPVLVIARDALSSLSRTERHILLTKAIKQLPKGTQDLFMNLAKSRGGHEIDDIVQTNSKGLRSPDHVGHLGVVPEAARINHACRPNSFYRFNDTSLQLEVFALRDIEPGEELTYSYGYSSLPHTSRHKALDAHWSFTCKCSLCTAPPAKISASDKRLKQITDIKEVLPTDTHDVPQLLGSVPDLIGLLQEEGLIAEIPQYEEILAYTLSQLGDEHRARYWARRARKGWEIVAGKGSWEAERTGALERDVLGHPSW